MAVQISGDTRLDKIDGNTIKSMLLADQDEDVVFDIKEGVDSDEPRDKHASVRLWRHLPS